MGPKQPRRGTCSLAGAPPPTRGFRDIDDLSSTGSSSSSFSCPSPDDSLDREPRLWQPAGRAGSAIALSARPPCEPQHRVRDRKPRGDCPATRGSPTHYAIAAISAPGPAWIVSAPHGHGQRFSMNKSAERPRDLIAQHAADWFAGQPRASGTRARRLCRTGSGGPVRIAEEHLGDCRDRADHF